MKIKVKFPELIDNLNNTIELIPDSYILLLQASQSEFVTNYIISLLSEKEGSWEIVRVKDVKKIYKISGNWITAAAETNEYTKKYERISLK